MIDIQGLLVGKERVGHKDQEQKIDHRGETLEVPPKIKKKIPVQIYLVLMI